MIDLRTASRSAARVARHRRAAPASELALVVLYTQAAIVGGLFQACPTDSISHCRFQCYRPLVAISTAVRKGQTASAEPEMKETAEKLHDDLQTATSTVDELSDHAGIRPVPVKG